MGSLGRDEHTHRREHVEAIEGAKRPETPPDGSSVLWADGPGTRSPPEQTRCPLIVLARRPATGDDGPVKTRILVLGAGFAGLELCTLVSEALGDSVDVTLIDRTTPSSSASRSST